MPLPERKKLRLIDYDYSQAGLYFVTICINNRRNLLWNDTNPSTSTQLVIVSLSKIGLTVDSAIQNISVYYPNVSVEKYVIMPNHIHLILRISGNGGRALRAPTISQ
ncbi:MAG: transposase, partial [Bellilinea sp.]